MELDRENYLKILPKYIKWKEDTYKKELWNIHTKLTNLILSKSLVDYSSITREKIIMHTAIDYSLDCMDTIVNLITMSNNKENIICGLTYSFIPNKYHFNLYDKNILPSTIVLASHNIITNYINIGPSLESVDGEYRNLFCNMWGFFKFQDHYPEIYKPILKYVKKLIMSRKYQFTRETFYSRIALKQEYDVDMDMHFETHEIVLVMFIQVWYISVYSKFFNIRETLTNSRYISFMDEYMEADLKFFQTLIAQHSTEDMTLIYKYLTNVCEAGKDNVTNLGFGQKLTPLNLLEIQNPFNARFIPWREYLVSNALSQLVINNICQGFPIAVNWVYIKGANRDLYNNEIQYKRVDRSDQAKMIVKYLVKSQSYGYAVGKRHRNIDETIGVVTEMLKDKFLVLNEKIGEAIDYGKNEIIMSDSSFMLISEYVGRTLFDSLKLCRNYEKYNDAIGRPFNGGHKYFKKYIFDICYSLYTMYKKLGIIHGDLHLNNLTMYQPFNLTDKFKEVKKPYVAYVMGKKNEYCFLLPSCGIQMMLIDFGRCFIDPKKVDKLKIKNIPDRYPPVHEDEKDLFNKEQIERLLNQFLSVFSNFRDQESELRILFNKRFNLVYKLLSVFDLYNVTKKLDTLFEVNHPDIVVPDNKCRFFVKKIVDLCTTYLVSDMTKLLEDKHIGDEFIDKLPIFNVILALFTPNLVNEEDLNNPPLNDASIIDIVFFNNEEKYDINRLDEIPSVYRFKKYIDEKGEEVEFTSAYLKKYAIERRIEYEKRFVKVFDTIDLIVRRQKEKFF